MRNGQVELDVSATMNVDLLEGTYVTDWHPFGGTYAFGAAATYAWAGIDATITGPLGGALSISPNTAAFGDTLIIPALIGWHDGDFHWSTALFISAPTGAYEHGQLNTGKNIWAFMPEFSLTWYEPESGVEISGALTYVTMTENDDTHYQSGDILHLDWAAGLHLDPHWEVGMVGNMMEQIGGDSGAGASLGPFKAESFGLGAGVSYSALWGHSPINFGVKWEHDIEARNTFSGDVVNVNLTVGF